MSSEATTADPKRFEVSRRILLVDFLMGWLVRLGGLAVVLVVALVLLFVAKEVVPLFRKARVIPQGEIMLPAGCILLGVDEWGEMPFFHDGGSKLVFANVANGEVIERELPGVLQSEVSAFHYDPVHRRITLALADGRIGSFLVRYERQFDEGQARTLVPEVVLESWVETEIDGVAVRRISSGGSDDERMLAIERGDGSLSVLRVRKKNRLVGGEVLLKVWEKDVTALVDGAASRMIVSPNGGSILVVCEDGGIRYLLADDATVRLMQLFRPFGTDAPFLVDFLPGGESVILTHAGGAQQQWSLFRRSEEGERLFGQVREFDSVGPDPAVFAVNQRNRSFLTGSGNLISLRHSTTGELRWSGNMKSEVGAGIMDAKGRHLFVALVNGSLLRYLVDDPHPEAGWKSFFGKVWYEGGSEPVYQWQASGGADQFEPKLSMVPLIFGSLKGATYGLAWSLPIALLAAVYTSAFLPARMKGLVKPAIEVMASLPSVILGFLAGYWLGPLLEDRVPSVLLIVTALPLSAVVAGFGWSRLPVAVRNSLPRGMELCLVLPILAGTGTVAWLAAPLLESSFFVYVDPATGEKVANFRMWWPQAMGVPFEQQNAMVFGFIMGFALIPVVYTISEDALSNVPEGLLASATALGASRWQVVRTVLLPVASPGIFSALVIGFGRAVGETMIMVMASGNTPITEWNLFSGFRSLSANIAIELPEAPVGSTHYRVLFLGAVLLFVLTFVMNTLAELLRHRLRERNSRI